MIARWSLLVTRLSLVLGSPAALAQIVTDGTVGPAVSLNGPEVTIGAELGTTRGGNLFHSFQRFDIPTGQRATFTGPDQIQNVIGRVTGGQTSQIDGTLRSTVGQADVYLINPAGVVMGPNARFDVPAALHLSTADELLFSDGSRYSARDPANSTLTMAMPESFGFLSPQPASLTIQGSQLELKPGKTATLTAGDVNLSGTGERRAMLKAPGGEIRIEAVGDISTEVPVATPSQAPGGGQLALVQTDLETSGDGGGQITVRAGSAQLQGSTLAADNWGETVSLGGIDLSLSNALGLSASRVQSNSFSGGVSGRVRIQAQDLTIRQDGAATFTGLFSEVEPGARGDSGGIDVSLRGTLEMQGAVGIESSTWGIGDGGAVQLNVRSVLMDGEGTALPYRGFDGYIAAIASEAVSHGHAGDVALTVADTLTVRNSGSLSSLTVGAGNAGTLKIQAGEIHLDGAGSGNVAITSLTGSIGNAGTLDLTVAGLFEVSNGAWVSSDTWASNQAGMVKIQAGEMRLDGGGLTDQFTGITSKAKIGSTGDAGTLDLQVGGLLEILNGAQINSSTDIFAKGDGGMVSIRAGDLTIDGEGISTGVMSDTGFGSESDAGRVTVDVAGTLALLRGAQIASTTYSSGAAGEISVRAANLTIDGASDPDSAYTGILASAHATTTGHAGTIRLEVSDIAQVVNDGVISTSGYGSGDTGEIHIQAGTLELLNDGRVTNDTFFEGNGGTIRVSVDDLLIDRGWITSDVGASASGRGGDIMVEASDSLLIRNTDLQRQQIAQIGTKTFGKGRAGNIQVRATTLELLNGAQISADTASVGDAGSILVQADNLRIDGQGQYTEITSGAHIHPELPSGGRGGDISVDVSGQIVLLNAGQISTDTATAGKAGTLIIRAGDLIIDGGVESNKYTGISSDTHYTGSGDAGNIQVEIAGLLDLEGEASISSDTFGAGQAGQILITADALHLSNGSEISSDTLGTKRAGDISVQANTLRLDGRENQGFTGISTAATSTSSGDAEAGSVTLTISGSMEILGNAVVWSGSDSTGDAGSIWIDAERILVDGAGTPLREGSDVVGGIFSNAGNGGGRAGTVTIHTQGGLELRDGTGIATASGSGDAGAVTIRVGELTLDGAGRRTGISSGIVTEGAIGQVGDLNLTANRVTLRDGGEFTIASVQKLDPALLAGRIEHRIQLHTDDLTMDHGLITAESTGNVPAAAIQIQAHDAHLTNDSRITTAAAQADAGPITIDGGRLWLTDSLITTSVTGENGNGGNITLTPEYLILDGGFIQANTAAIGASGGDILIDSHALIASEGLVEIGGATRQTFTTDSGRNIIQAAAPDGEQGTIDVTSPDLDITAALVPLTTAFDDPDDLLTDLCRGVTGSAASSLVERGAGGLSPNPFEPAAVSFVGTRLDRLNTP